MAVRFRGTDEESRALHAYIALMRAASSVTAHVHTHLDAVDLTLGQFAVLEALVHVGPLRQNELARRILSSPGNLSIVLDNLQKRKLVRRQSDPADARCVVVSATDKALRLIGEIFPGHVRRLVQEFGVLSAVEQENLRRICRRFGRQQE